MKKKYYNYYNGKKEREPTDREQKEEYFAGYDDLKKLSLGIAEQGDGIDDEQQDSGGRHPYPHGGHHCFV